MVREPPKVTGLSPMKGLPGTKITIRGENLGLSGDDLIGLTICGTDCLPYAEWKSSSKIVTRSGRCLGAGDVIVETRSGGAGTSTVQFFGYEEKVSLTSESAVWVDEHDFVVGGIQRQTSSPTAIDADSANDILGLGQKLNNNSGSPFSPVHGGGGQSDLRELRNLFPGVTEAKSKEYGDIMSPDFMPAWCLVTQYSSVSLADLSEGLESLKAKIKNQERQENARLNSFDDRDEFDDHNTFDDGLSNNSSSSQGEEAQKQKQQQRAAFLKANILSIIECLDVLKALNLTFRKDKQEIGPELTSKVEASVVQAMNEAHQIFDLILSKKDLADATRGALNILQRYRFLFNLPSSIEKSLQRGDYDVVINEFSIAKSLFATTQVSVFKRVYEKIEQKIDQLRGTLDQKLDMSCRATREPRDIDEVKKFIRQLNSLDDNKIDHAWKSIERLHKSLVKSIQECHDHHLSMAIAAHYSLNSNKQNTARNGTTIFTVVGENEATKLLKSAPPVVQFVDEVTTLLNENFIDLYRLGLAYFNEEFAVSIDDLHSPLVDFGHEMIFKTLELFCKVLRSALIPQSHHQIISINNSNKRSSTDDARSKSSSDRSLQTKWPSDFDEKYVVWIKHVLKCIMNCRSKLIKAEFSSYAKDALDDLRNFMFELRVQSMVVLFEQAAVDIRAMHLREDWEIDVDDIYGGRTQLPLLFERKVIDTLQLARDTIFQTTSSDETGLFTRIDVQATMKQLAQSMIQSFLSALDEALTGTKNQPAEDNYNLKASTASIRLCSNFNNRHLVVICNCLFTTNQVFPRLRDQFEKLQYPDMNLVMKKCHEKYLEYEKKIFDAYCETKCQEVMGESNGSPSAPNRYVSVDDFEVYFNLLQVRSQVFLIAPPLVEKVTDCLKSMLYGVSI